MGIFDDEKSWEARREIQRAVVEAVLIPNRLVARWVRRIGKTTLSDYRKLGVRYRFHPAAMFVLGGNRVVTVLPSTVEDLATVLTWLMTGQWLDESETAA